jgi:transcriptional regulator NrdR family protein
MEAMLAATEALSANHFTWLRGVALPHWYQRYNRSWLVNNLDHSLQKQELTQDDIKADIQHLLDEIRTSNSSDIMDMYEIKKLMLIWRQLTASESVKNCNQCIHKIH